MFTPFRLRDLVIPNRVVVSPMCQYVADDGTVGDWHVVHLGSRAIGGAGLVMAEMTDVSRDARISPHCAGLYKREHAHAWRRVVDFIHRETPGQGWHSAWPRRPQGRHAAALGRRQRADGGGRLAARLGVAAAVFRRSLADAARDDAAPTWMRCATTLFAPRELAIEAGFDLLEIHMAHGYLLASFISPLTNRRDDDYGGVAGSIACGFRSRSSTPAGVCGRPSGR